MTPFLHAAVQAADPEGILDRCLRELGKVPSSANLGFLYATDALASDLPNIVAELRERFPGVFWLGTVGVGICGTGREFYDAPALSLMIGALPGDLFRPLPSLLPDGTGDDDGVLAWWTRQEGGLAFLHADPTRTETPLLLQQMVELSPNGFINGGLTSSNSAHPQICGALTDGPLSGLLLAGGQEILTDHSQGCSPLGPTHQLTESQRNIAVRLDGRPALEVMKADMGEVLTRNLRQAAGYIYAALPISGSDTGDYLVRNLLGIDEERGLIAISDLLDDQERLLFCRRDGNTALEDLRRMLMRMEKRIGARTVRGGLYISCIARGRHQFGPDSEELRMISQTLGEFPLVGFFANGEIYNGRVYGYTGVLTLFL